MEAGTSFNTEVSVVTAEGAVITNYEYAISVNTNRGSAGQLTVNQTAYTGSNGLASFLSLELRKAGRYVLDFAAEGLLTSSSAFAVHRMSQFRMRG